VVSKNNLSCLKGISNESVCDTCQKAKSQQLPFPKSFSVSKAPLELIFSDVWGLAPISVGRYKYYVSFIDDYNKFTWVYLLKKNLMCFTNFMNFRSLLNNNTLQRSLPSTLTGGRVSKAYSLLPAHGHHTPHFLSSHSQAKWVCGKKALSHC
jgi:hypothetical protein